MKNEKPAINSVSAFQPNASGYMANLPPKGVDLTLLQRAKGNADVARGVRDLIFKLDHRLFGIDPESPQGPDASSLEGLLDQISCMLQDATTRLESILERT